MTKKYSTSTTLVIVESPAKCKKIEQYLGPGYLCLASYGHFREIFSLENIDFNNNYNPIYSTINNEIKLKQLEIIRKAIKKTDEVILASDDDREGESIAWHICDYFKLDIYKTKRIIFHEITESAILYAIKNPKRINIDLVNAQQARQVLDILVGYKISPILWKYISTPKGKEYALSAGRCQTPALRLIYDNELEIFKEKENTIFNTTGYFTNLNLPFILNKQFKCKEEIINFLEGVIHFNHTISVSSPIIIYKKAPEPFSTSRLQQTASNELHYSPKETMKICQKLYEAGFITYMRTDSKYYSSEFINEMKIFINKSYINGESYIDENIDLLVNNINAQEAHESIRPTNINLLVLPDEMDNKEKKMYKLIWINTIESCMKSASYFSITSTINSFNNNNFIYKCEKIDCKGWKIVKNNFSLDNKEYSYLELIKSSSNIQYKKITSKFNLEGLKLHYTEAKLIQLLEEKGIGRPSTFSSIVEKIQERGYVKKMDIKGKEIEGNDYELEKDSICIIKSKREFGNEKNKIVLQPTGKIVIEFIIKNFDKLFNYDFTSNMENTLDKIAQGTFKWNELCESCDNQIMEQINIIKEEKKFEIKLDENNTFIIGKFGPVIKNIEIKNGIEEIKFKKIKKEVDIENLGKGIYIEEDIIDLNKKTNSQFVLGKYKNMDVTLKKGKFGIYAIYNGNSISLKNLGNRPMENITLTEIESYLDEGSNIIREISKDLYIRKGPKGDYIFYKNNKMKKPKFFDIKSFITDVGEDYTKCNISILKCWIETKYKI